MMLVHNARPRRLSTRKVLEARGRAKRLFVRPAREYAGWVGDPWFGMVPLYSEELKYAKTHGIRSALALVGAEEAIRRVEARTGRPLDEMARDAFISTLKGYPGVAHA